MDENSIKMVVPCSCPHCGGDIILNINQPYPDIDVLTPEQVPDDIKNIITDHDITSAS